MQNAIGYVRVSTEEQAVEGISVEVQRAKIAAWCEASGYTLTRLCVDAGLSGSRSDNRPGLQEALTLACKQKAALVVYSLSRLARSTRDAIAISDRLDKSGADLVSLSEKLDTTSAAGRMMFRLLAVLAEFERDVIAERTKGAMAHLRSQGRRISRHLPFGYDLGSDGVTLSPNVKEQTAIQTMHILKQQGLSLRAIAAALTAQDVPTKSGRPWTPKVLKFILERKAA